MEKRNNTRISLKNMFVDIYDGNGAFRGNVKNISWKGLCLADLPKRINVEVKRLTIIVSEYSGNESYKMFVEPKWSNHANISKTVGAEIITPPLGWKEMVMNLEPPMPDKKNVEEIVI